jgi:hypothetical protein
MNGKLILFANTQISSDSYCSGIPEGTYLFSYDRDAKNSHLKFPDNKKGQYLFPVKGCSSDAEKGELGTIITRHGNTGIFRDVIIGQQGEIRNYTMSPDSEDLTREQATLALEWDYNADGIKDLFLFGLETYESVDYSLELEGGLPQGIFVNQGTGLGIIISGKTGEVLLTGAFRWQDATVGAYLMNENTTELGGTVIVLTEIVSAVPTGDPIILVEPNTPTPSRVITESSLSQLVILGSIISLLILAILHRWNRHK